MRHLITQEINAHGLDIDKGMVIKFGNNFYHGGNTMTIMALLGSRYGWFKKMNAVFFCSKSFA